MAEADCTDAQRLRSKVLRYSDITDPLDVLVFQGPLDKYDVSDLVYRQFALLEKNNISVVSDVSFMEDFKGLIEEDAEHWEDCVDELADFFSSITSSVAVSDAAMLVAPDWIISGRTDTDGFDYFEGNGASLT